MLSVCGSSQCHTYLHTCHGVVLPEVPPAKKYHPASVYGVAQQPVKRPPVMQGERYVRTCNVSSQLEYWRTLVMCGMVTVTQCVVESV